MKIIEKLKNKKTLGMIGIFIAGALMGNLSAPLCSESDHDGIEEKVAGLEVSIQEKDKEIENLNAKVDSAKPYFDMKEEEQAKLEADAKKAEEDRLAKEEEERVAKEQAKLEAKSVTFSNGNYIAGDDFEAGVYDIVAVKGGGNVSSSNMFSGGLNAVMGVQNDGFYEKEYKNIKLPAGTELTISGVTVKLIPKN